MDEQPNSVWKKEISFRRKPKAEQPVAESQPSPSIWKKEITLGRKAAPAPEVEPVVEARPEPFDEPERTVIELPPLEAEPFELAPVAHVAEPEPPAPDPLPDPLPDPEPEPEVEPVLAAEVSLDAWEEEVPLLKRQFSFRRTPKAAKAPKAKVARERKPKREREQTPLHKREISLKRKPRAAKDEAPKQPKQPKQKRAPKLKGESKRASRGGKKIVGLKIGASQIAASVVDNGSLELIQAVREPLEHGIVVGGEVRDPEALAVALKDFFTKHKLPKRGIRLGIANNRIGVRTFELAGIDDPKQLANAVRFRAQEVLPIPPEEAVLDYQVLGESLDDEGNLTRRVLLVVAYRDLVERYVYAAHKAGLQIVGIDLEAFALLRAIAEPHDPQPGSDRGALVAVAVGHDRSTFAVSDGRVCEFTRVLEWGGWALNVAIARALDLAPSEAEEIKLALSFTGADPEAPAGVTPERMEAAREAARRQLQSFARELVSSLQFYQAQPGSLGIGEIVLTGGTAHLPGLGAELERLVGVPVRIADPLMRVRVSKNVKERIQVGSLAVAIGLGIED